MSVAATVAVLQYTFDSLYRPLHPSRHLHSLHRQTDSLDTMTECRSSQIVYTAYQPVLEARQTVYTARQKIYRECISNYPNSSVSRALTLLLVDFLLIKVQGDKTCTVATNRTCLSALGLSRTKNSGCVFLPESIML